MRSSSHPLVATCEDLRCRFQSEAVPCSTSAARPVPSAELLPQQHCNTLSPRWRMQTHKPPLSDRILCIRLRVCYLLQCFKPGRQSDKTVSDKLFRAYELIGHKSSDACRFWYALLPFIAWPHRLGGASALQSPCSFLSDRWKIVPTSSC